MDTKTFEAILQKATTAALDAGCAEIQRALGVKNGDAAGVYFSGSGADAVRDALRGYMVLEIAYLADTPEDAPPATQSEAPGEARERACWAAAERVKCAVLHALEPLGFVDALPIGFSLMGTANADARILALGHAFEQITQARRAPEFRP